MTTKTFTPQEFEKFLARSDWQRSQNQEILERMVRDDFNRGEIPHAYGWASLTSELDGVKITYTESFSFDECERDSLSASTEGQNEIWSIQGVRIIDEDGDESDPELWMERDGGFDAIDYSFLDSEFEQTEDIDMDSDKDIITLKIDNAPSLRFRGDLVASASSSDNNASGDYSGSTGRWTELELYKTAGGKFVCHEVGRTRWQGEHDRCEGRVCESEAEVIKFFGHGWLAKELYNDAGIADVTEIE